MKCFVTGASGFIGANLVHELNARGHHVRALLRPGADLRGLTGADFEPVPGELSDRPAIEKAVRGCDWCFHVAASYHLWLPDYTSMYAANVEGTRHVLEAAYRAGCSRIIHTSTAGCLGQTRVAEEEIVSADETTPVAEAEMTNHYKRSKWRAEAVAQELVERGAPIVIVNPTAPAGPRDVKPTPTGRFILDVLNGRMPAVLDTGLNWVHVRDVATGFIFAAEKGRVGERYILGHAAGNWTMKEAIGVLAELSGAPATGLRIPYWVAWTAAHLDETLSRFTARPPRVPLAGVRMARQLMFFNPGKAILELNLPQTSPRDALADAVTWFRTHGYVKKGALSQAIPVAGDPGMAREWRRRGA